MEDKLERYMDFAGAVPPCVTPARLEQLAASIGRSSLS